MDKEQRQEAERKTKGVIGNVCSTLAIRADLLGHPISMSLMFHLAQYKSLSMIDLIEKIADEIKYPISPANVKRAIAFTNEKFRIVNNLDPELEPCVAHIGILTCEVAQDDDEFGPHTKYYDRVFMVHNL